MFGIKRHEPETVHLVSPNEVSSAIQARLALKKRKREEVDLPAAGGLKRAADDSNDQNAAPPNDVSHTVKRKKHRPSQIQRKSRRAALKAAEKASREDENTMVDDPLTVEDEEEARRLRKERKARLKAERRLKKAEDDHQVNCGPSETNDQSNSVEHVEEGPPAALEKKRSVRFDESTLVSTASAPNEGDDVTIADAQEPTQSVGLQRLPRPKRVEAPDRRLLQELSVAEELRDGLQVDPDTTLDIDLLLNQTRKRHLLGTTLQQRLADAGIDSFFAVQAAILPLLLEQTELYPQGGTLPDLCVSAPTGSGKTLAYVLPIIQTLSKRVVTRLRALIVLPTRDLAQQVKEVFEAFCKGTDLQVGAAYGQHTFQREQELIVGHSEESLAGGQSKADILLATPGRLLEHLRSTANFTLQHLRFFVIDEADRLVGQSFGEWLPTVLTHIEATEIAPAARLTPSAVAPQLLASLYPAPTHALSKPRPPLVQKLLFSATLSRDPAQIAGLHLRRPIYVAVREAGPDSYSDESFSLPTSLKEYMITSAVRNKPLVLFYLLATKRLTRGICFAKSVEAASRLVKLIEAFSAEQQKVDPAFPSIRAAAFVSDLPAAKRTKMLDSFKAGHLQLLVCSDLIARGMDIPNVDQVVSYDAPIDMRKYVHRVGRTARAGRTGEAWSLVEKQEVAHFQTMLERGGRKDKVALERIRKRELQNLQPAYEAALASLQIQGERRG